MFYKGLNCSYICFFFMDCLLLCIQTLKTFLFTPTREQNCCTSCSSCFWIFHPNLSANSIILSFCSWVNFVLNLLFFNEDGRIDLAACKFDWKILRSSLDDSAPTLPPPPPKVIIMGAVGIVGAVIENPWGYLWWREAWGGGSEVGSCWGRANVFLWLLFL